MIYLFEWNWFSSWKLIPIFSNRTHAIPVDSVKEKNSLVKKKGSICRKLFLLCVGILLYLLLCCMWRLLDFFLSCAISFYHGTNGRNDVLWSLKIFTHEISKICGSQKPNFRRCNLNKRYFHFCDCQSYIKRLIDQLSEIFTNIELLRDIWLTKSSFFIVYFLKNWWSTVKESLGYYNRYLEYFSWIFSFAKF